MIDAPIDNPSEPSSTTHVSVDSESDTSLTEASAPAVIHHRLSSEQMPAGWLGWIKQGLRANMFRSVRDLPSGPGAWSMLLIVGLISLVVTLASRYEFTTHTTFSLRTWLFGWATTGLLIAGLWLVNTWGRRHSTHPSPTAAWYLLYVVAVFPIGIVSAVLTALSARHQMPDWWSSGAWYAWALYLLLWVWIGCVSWRVSKAVNRSGWVALGILVWMLVVESLNSSLLRTNAWEVDYSEDDGAESAATESSFPKLTQEVFETQQSLFSSALGDIKVHHGKQRQLYALIYAPYSQDVFLRESAMVQEVLENRFGARGHVVRLVNHRTTNTTIPWATNLNLERSLEAISKAMDPQRDVMTIYMTSHGGSNFKLAASNWPLEVEPLTALQLRAMLDRFGIVNRVIIISACYSGGWVEPLKSDDTLVMTAADKEHTSYGCGNKSDLTFFGRALFDEQLRKTLSFEDAFNTAVPIIKQREIDGKKDDGFSNPQISMGAKIKTVLQQLTQQLDPDKTGISP